MNTAKVTYDDLMAPTRKAPWWARLFGKRHRDSSYRFRWGEFAPGKWGVACKLYHYEEPGLLLSLIWGAFYIHLPNGRFARKLWPQGFAFGESESYGFMFYVTGEWAWQFWWHWGRKTKIVDPPWGWNKRRGDYLREYLTQDGEWIDYRQFPHSWIAEGVEVGGEPWTETHTYHYMTHGGEAQHVEATIRRERTTMVYRILGIPVRRQVKHSIDVSFAEEVGNQRGSWKGGVTGAGHEMRPGEEPIHTLRRMQRERDFCR